MAVEEILVPELAGTPNKRTFLMIDNYIYIHHINKYIVLPSFVDSVTDSQQVHFSQTTPLARSAPAGLPSCSADCVKSNMSSTI